MADNLENIDITPNEWVDLYQLANVPVGKVVSVENVGNCDIYVAVQATKPDTDHKAYNILERKNGVRLQNTEGDSGAWAFCNSSDAKIQVIPQDKTGFYPHQTVTIKTEGEPLSPSNPLPASDVDGAHRTAANSIFGDRIVGTRVPTIAAQFQYGLRADDAVVDIVATGSVAIDDAMLKLNTGAAADGHAGIQGADYVRYIPGHEAYAFFTCVFAPPAIGLIQRIGLFDFDGGDGNGFFVGFEGEVFGITRRRAGVDVFTPVDVAGVFPTDSGVFDPAKGNVYKLSYGYLGFAPIHFEVLLPEGAFREFADIEYPNTSTETHIANTNIPLRAEMTNTGSTADSQMRIGSVSAGIVDGGGADPIARVFSQALGPAAIPAGTQHQLIHFRNKAEFFGITNKISSQLILVSAATEGNKPVSWGILKNADITTPGTWTDVDPDSVIEYSTNQVVDLATGRPILFWDMATRDSFFEDVEKYLVKLRPNEWATFFVQSSNASEVTLSIRYRDLF